MMPVKQRDPAVGVGSNGGHSGKPYRDTEWYKKRREDVPAINRGNPSENPFKLLFQNGQNGERAGRPKKSAESNQQESGD